MRLRESFSIKPILTNSFRPFIYSFIWADAPIRTGTIVPFALRKILFYFFLGRAIRWIKFETASAAKEAVSKKHKFISKLPVTHTNKNKNDISNSISPGFAKPPPNPRQHSALGGYPLRSILQRLHQVRRLNVLTARQICDRARQFQNAMVSVRR
jgi:hypothetical protein